MKRGLDIWEHAIRWGLIGCASVTLAAVFLIFFFLGKEGLPALLHLPLDNLFSDRWAPVSLDKPGFGLFPLVAGSLLVTALATLLAVPFGVGGATYLAAFARQPERELLKPFIEILAGIPSVVLGFFGLVVLGPIVKAIFGLPSGLTALTGALLLAFMAIPTIMTIAEDALHAVPQAYRDASLALGASPWQTTWRVVVPAAAPGIAAAVLLGIGRVIGETMAVMMVTGNAPLLTASPFESVRTMTATIAAEMGEVPFGSEHYQVLFLTGLVLLGMTLVVNLYARGLLTGKRRRNR